MKERHGQPPKEAKSLWSEMNNTLQCCVLVGQPCLVATLWTVAPRILCPWQLSRQENWSGLPCLPPGDLSNPGIKPRSPALQADSLPSESSGKLKNTGVGSLSLLQGIFLTQESNQGILHWRRTLYQLSYQGSPHTTVNGAKYESLLGLKPGKQKT